MNTEKTFPAIPFSRATATVATERNNGTAKVAKRQRNGGNQNKRRNLRFTSFGVLRFCFRKINGGRFAGLMGIEWYVSFPCYMPDTCSLNLKFADLGRGRILDFAPRNFCQASRSCKLLCKERDYTQGRPCV